MVGVGDPPVGIDRQHASRNAFQDRFHVLTALLDAGVGVGQFTAGVFDLMAARFQLLGHAVEGSHQIADFVRGSDFNPVVETSAGNFLGGFRQTLQSAA